MSSRAEGARRPGWWTSADWLTVSPSRRTARFRPNRLASPRKSRRGPLKICSVLTDGRAGRSLGSHVLIRDVLAVPIGRFRRAYRGGDRVVGTSRRQGREDMGGPPARLSSRRFPSTSTDMEGAFRRWPVVTKSPEASRARGPATLLISGVSNRPERSSPSFDRWRSTTTAIKNCHSPSQAGTAATHLASWC